MKRNLLSFGAILLLQSAILISCSKKDTVPDPIANFDYTAIGGNLNAPSTVEFTNTSNSAIKFLWNFGDGTSSTEEHPKHKYASPGSYTVILESSIGGKTNSKSQIIVIQPAKTKVAISKFRLSSLSESSSFTGYIRIANAVNTELWRSVNFTINPSEFPKEWAISTPYIFTDLSLPYFFEVWKYGVLFDSKLTDSPFAPYLLNMGTNSSNSYPVSSPGLNGITFGLQWQ